MTTLRSVKVGQSVWLEEKHPAWQGRCETRLVSVEHINNRGRLFISTESLWNNWRYGFDPATGKAKAYEWTTMRYASPDEVRDYQQEAEHQKAETLAAEEAMKAKAKLRESAPELLATLTAILDAWQDNELSRDDFCELMGDRFEPQIERVIRKAKGDQP